MEPFAIHVTDQVFEDLRARIRATRWPEPAPAEPWWQGTDLDYLKDLVGFWADGFDWRAQEHRLNAFAHFRLEIDGSWSTSSMSGHQMARVSRSSSAMAGRARSSSTFPWFRY